MGNNSLYSNEPEKEKKVVEKEPKQPEKGDKVEEVKKEGAFISSLKRNNKQIREDRATAIAEDTQLMFKRTIEDLEVDIKRMRRDRENMLDLSPTNAQSLVVASDFKSKDFVKKDIDLGVDIRNAEITLEIAKTRYEHLFGESK